VTESPLVREALRLCDRYVAEVVLAFGLCPWAEGVLRAGALGRRVLPDPTPSVGECLAIIDDWAAAGAPGSGAAPIDVGFIVFPLRGGSRGAFDSFAEAVRSADRGRRGPERPAPFMIAVFHPAGARRFSGPHQLVSYLRRTPDPTLQLVRADLLDRVTRAAPGVSNQIAERNHATLVDGAVAARFAAVVDDLRADRDRTYAALGFGTSVGGVGPS